MIPVPFMVSCDEEWMEIDEKSMEDDPEEIRKMNAKLRGFIQKNIDAL